ncbi:uncharacterized protein LOC132708826 isoform X2 [Cylas formicarius]|uniref:uncharacterized protein LOC132708826 isoform X2 n=1 Tax=Cylas formicarius TaxID=197179 RepID=UPI002958CA28|nr:uncharacterized protein LOC132708826 isoform X2 [Cylas formicarius]XP_060537420.1 uncharacterized protein LOC132708826 isoform X2 [Cylas formicarius]
MKILHWNICSFRRNKDSLIRLIRDFSPHIVIINESFLLPHIKISLPGFSFVREDRPDCYGGIIVFVRYGIKYGVLDVSAIQRVQRCQVIGITVNSFTLVAVYNPPDLRVSRSILDQLLELSNGSPVVFIGDFNAHNLAWGSRIASRVGIESGKVILDFIQDNGLLILNDGNATRFTRNDTHSVPDIVFCSYQIVPDFDFQVLGGRGFSDHFPILCQLGDIMEPDKSLKSSATGNCNFNKADWVLFSRLVFSTISLLLLQSARKAIPSRKGNHKFGLHWWDEECSRVIRLKRETFRGYKNNPSDENFINVKKNYALCRRTLRAKRKSSLVKFCESLSPFNRVSEV